VSASTERTRARVFGEAADLYDRRRPGYPAALFEDLLDAVDRGEHALEAGAGTGKASIELARRGVEVTAFEPDRAMASLARRSCARLPVRIYELPFEDWRGTASSFDLVISAQAWHWIDPDTGWAIARRALRQGGVLAVWWNQAGDWAGPVREALDAAYARHAPELSGSVVNSPVHPLRAGSLSADGFDAIEPRSYAWTQRYDSASYTELLQTHSDHRMLPPERLDELLEAVTAVINDVGGGEIVYPYRTDLLMARRGGGPVGRSNG
jgi:SAM-dependent methyltransferase